MERERLRDIFSFIGIFVTFAAATLVIEHVLWPTLVEIWTSPWMSRSILR
jgi:hypothetical protein